MVVVVEALGEVRALLLGHVGGHRQRSLLMHSAVAGGEDPPAGAGHAEKVVDGEPTNFYTRSINAIGFERLPRMPAATQ